MAAPLVVAAALFAVSLTGTAGQCPATCSCTSDVIDCSNRGFAVLPEVTRPEADRLARIDFSNNDLAVLDVNALFTFIIGLRVDVIDFSSNRISDVVGTFDFTEGKDYQTLNLSRNALRSFPANVIPVIHARGVFVVDVSYNRLTELTERMFAGGDDATLPGFQFIATNNLISSLHPETFQGVDIIDAVVDLRFNRLRTLSEDFRSPRSVEQLRFSENPWNCDCDLRWIITPSNLLVNTTADFPPSCRTPAAVQGRPIFQLRGDEFACFPVQNGPLEQNFLNMDTFIVRCPVTADPPEFEVRWQVWLPSPFGVDPVQLFFTSQTVGMRELRVNPRAAFKCTASNNAGSLTLALDVRFNGEPGIPVPECPLVQPPDQCFA